MSSGARVLVHGEEDTVVLADEGEMSMEDAIEQIGIGRVQWMLLIIAGLTFMSDAAEVTFLSYVTEELKCKWGLTGSQQTKISQAVFVGMICGAPVWGKFADSFGRRPAFLWSSVVICLFGFATALCPGYYSLLVVRAMVGFGVSGLPVGFDILAEALPSSGRGQFLLYIEYFWTLGSIYVNICAWLVLERFGWQLFTVMAAIPTLVASIIGYFLLPESPMWLQETGKSEEALAIINDWAKKNKREVKFTQLTPIRDSDQGAMSDLCKKGLRRITSIMMLLWFAWGLAYYGVVCLLPRIFDHMEKQSSTTITTTTTDALGRRLSDDCSVKFAFGDIAISVVAEVMGVVFALMLIDRAGRVGTQAIFFILGAIAAFILGFRDIDINILTAVASIGRLSQMAASCSCWVHTPELFPTKVRAQAHANLNVASKVGAVAAQYLISDSFSQVACGSIMASVSFVAGIAALALPETAGKDLKSSADKEEDSGEELDSESDDQASE